MGIQIDTKQVALMMRQRGMNQEADALEQGEAVLGTICEIAGFNRQYQGMATQEQRSCDQPGAQLPGIPSLGNIPGLPMARGTFPACYSDCRNINPCLRPYLENQALQIDAFSLLELYKNEAEIVHMNTSVGAAPFITALPLAANQSMIFVQEVGQQLAYVPGLLKVKATFSDGNDHQSDLGLTLYAGPRGLTGITSITGLTVIGRPYTFEDFVCGTSCYLAPWPKLFNCGNQVIPGERSVYAVVNAGALGAVTVTGLSIVTIKANTDQFVNCCKQMKG